MEKILEALKGHVRVNDNTKDVELFNEYGTKMRLQVDAETLDEFKKHFPTL
jgi:hypothetical protein